jgi:D-threo-aldose 1-dehydrogenase
MLSSVDPIAGKLEKIKVLCAKHSVPIKAAALQFSLAHPASTAIIPRASKPDRIKEDQSALKMTIPTDFWRDLRAQGFVAPNAPLPIDSK